MAGAFAEAFVAVVAVDGFVDCPVAVLFAVALFVEAHVVDFLAAVRLAGCDSVGGGFDFVALFLLPYAFAYFFLRSVNLFGQPHQQIRVLFLLACRW